MKKWFSILALLLIVFITASYVFVPGTLKVSQLTNIGTTINGANRVLQDDKSWSKWWPAKNHQQKIISDQGLSYDGFHYLVSEKLYNQFLINTNTGEAIVTGRITILPFSNDSLHVFWTYDIATSKNPLKRISQYLQARQLRENAEEILHALKTFLEKNENIYGVKIHLTTTEKTFLVATTSDFKHYPNSAELAQMIDKLRLYIAAEDAKETGYPMVNTSTLETGGYQTMIAIPVNTELKGTTNITMRKIVTVKALFATTKGGPETIRKVILELNQYATDHKLFSPAIPYESLVTDRTKEPDTSKWITDVYLPLL